MLVAGSMILNILIGITILTMRADWRLAVFTVIVAGIAICVLLFSKLKQIGADAAFTLSILALASMALAGIPGLDYRFVYLAEKGDTVRDIPLSEITNHPEASMFYFTDAFILDNYTGHIKETSSSSSSGRRITHHYYAAPVVPRSFVNTDNGHLAVDTEIQIWAIWKAGDRPGEASGIRITRADAGNSKKAMKNSIEENGVHSSKNPIFLRMYLDAEEKVQLKKSIHSQRHS